jgi:hypothetical protein
LLWNTINIVDAMNDEEINQKTVSWESKLNHFSVHLTSSLVKNPPPPRCSACYEISITCMHNKSKTVNQWCCASIKSPVAKLHLLLCAHFPSTPDLKC